MLNSRLSLLDLIEKQRAFDEQRATTFQWSGAITAQQTHPLVHNALSLAGEAGEIANLVKKLDRGDFGFAHLMDELPGELADVMIYVMKIAYQSGIDLELAIQQKMDANADRFPATSPESAASKVFKHEFMEKASTIVARLDNERVSEVAAIFWAEGLTPSTDPHHLVVGALLALHVAKLAELEGSAAAQEAAWRRVAPVAEWLPISYEALVTLARHDVELGDLLNTPTAKTPAVA
jgi:NTP pyrophosphatase (non-canonical NTP hydrolase)